MAAERDPEPRCSRQERSAPATLGAYRGFPSVEVGGREGKAGVKQKGVIKRYLRVCRNLVCRVVKEILTEVFSITVA